MAREILTPLQKNFLRFFAQNKSLNRRFYLTGGTALAAYYLFHRYSEDLDFFSLGQVDTLEINTFLREIKKSLAIKKIDLQQSFNRNIFFLHTFSEVLKVEFTYFPFEPIEKPLKENGVLIDSLIDIATNKVFTIYQNPRARDFVDLYFILREYGDLTLAKFIKNARIKFDAQIDPLQLGTQLIKAKNIQDTPRMLEKTDHQQWRYFFVQKAKLLSKEILS